MRRRSPKELRDIEVNINARIGFSRDVAVISDHVDRELHNIIKSTNELFLETSSAIYNRMRELEESISVLRIILDKADKDLS
jgi:hypothetical protein